MAIGAPLTSTLFLPGYRKQDAQLSLWETSYFNLPVSFLTLCHHLGNLKLVIVTLTSFNTFYVGFYPECYVPIHILLPHKSILWGKYYHHCILHIYKLGHKIKGVIWIWGTTNLENSHRNPESDFWGVFFGKPGKKIGDKAVCKKALSPRPSDPQPEWVWVVTPSYPCPG